MHNTLQLSSLLSTVFICSFMVAAPIFGYLGDRFNRKVILSCGIFFWSAVTFSSSFIPQQVRSPKVLLLSFSPTPCPVCISPGNVVLCSIDGGLLQGKATAGISVFSYKPAPQTRTSL
jgi:MFS family permease